MQPDLTLIVSPPRTGGTLFYLLMCQDPNYCYISNELNYYYPDNLLTGIDECLSIAPENVRLFNNYGKTVGMDQPSECNTIWKRLFGENQYGPDPIDFVPHGADRFYEFIKKACDIYDRKLVMKSSWGCFRIPAIRRILGSSLRVILIWRNIADAAKSDLLARYITRKNIDQWTGPKPPDYDDLKKLSVCHQVVENQYSHYKEAKKYADTIIGYHELIENYNLQPQFNWIDKLPKSDQEKIDSYIDNHRQRFKEITT